MWKMNHTNKYWVRDYWIEMGFPVLDAKTIRQYWNTRNCSKGKSKLLGYEIIAAARDLTVIIVNLMLAVVDVELCDCSWIVDFISNPEEPHAPSDQLKSWVYALHTSTTP